MPDSDDIQAKMQALKHRFVALLPEILNEIEQVWNRLPQTEWEDESYQTLHCLVHRLTGSGKTFGLPLLSAASRELEENLKQLLQTKTFPDENQRNHIHGLMRKLHQASLRGDGLSL